MPILAIIIIIIMLLVLVSSSLNIFEGLKARRLQASDGIKYIVKSDGREALYVLSHINYQLINMVEHLRNKYIRDKQGTNKQRRWAYNVWRRFDPSAITENIPTGINDTSWVKNKGQEMSLCLNDKNGNLHDNHIMEFVALHEMSHIASDSYGHGKKFWEAFKFILKEAKEAGIHIPVQYSESPQEYCGIAVDYTPYYDNNLKIH